MESRHLAIMMTDIQGFTRATSGMDRDQVEALLARHEELLKPCFGQFDGTVVKGLGDAFLVTFESPTKAVQAGVRVQEVLAEYNRKAEAGERLRVRVALNAGEVNLRGGDIFGEAVNITARVEGVCAAEQVTLTEAVHLLLDREKLETEYLEEVTLKGIPFGVKLYRVSPHWLEPEERGIEKARSSYAEAKDAPGPARWLWAGAALALAVSLGSLAARPPDALTRAQALIKAGEATQAWELLEETRSRSPSPELDALAREFVTGRIEAFGKDGKSREAWDELARFARSWPGVEGLSDPPALAQKGIATVAALRAAGRFPEADRLLAELESAGRTGSARDTLAGWAKEDLVRTWDAAAKAGGGDGAGLARALGADEVGTRLRRLEALKPGDPFAAFVRGAIAMLGSTGISPNHRGSSDLEYPMKAFGAALSQDPELADRVEAEPVYRALTRFYPPWEDEWNWGDQLLALRVGRWLEPRLRAWVDEPPAESAGMVERLDNFFMRRNSRRVLERRGVPANHDRRLEAALDLEVIRTRTDVLGDKRLLEELATLDLNLDMIDAVSRGPLLDLLRRTVTAWLAGDDETIWWREELTKMAKRRGFAEAYQPDRELARDLDWALRKRTWSHSFRIDEWDKRFLRDRYPRVAALTGPHRDAVKALLEASLKLVSEKAPDLAAEHRAALDSMGK